MAEMLFATAATAEQGEAGIGIIWWEAKTSDGFALRVIDYRIDEMSAIDAEWIAALFARCADLVDQHKPDEAGCFLRVEHPGLLDVLDRADKAYRETGKVNRSLYDISRIKEHEKRKWPASLDERVSALRPLVDSGKVVKLETGLRRFIFRANTTNHLVAQLKRYSPGDAASAGELFNAFVLGVLLGTTPRSMGYFEAMAQRDRNDAKKAAGSTSPPTPFGAYVPGRRPLP